MKAQLEVGTIVTVGTAEVKVFTNRPDDKFGGILHYGVTYQHTHGELRGHYQMGWFPADILESLHAMQQEEARKEALTHMERVADDWSISQGRG